jgi:choline dehydrogenase-like flavoprotein
MTHYDTIIIGSGAGGGTLANTLAKAGKNILILERGAFLPREVENWSPQQVFQNGRYISPDTWHDGQGKAFQPQSHYFVGGATKMYGAALFRLRPQDFNVMQHSDGESPAWPISYADIEPWYTQAEQMYHVHGNHGEDPTEGPWSAQYPHPPISHSPRIREISDDLTSAGYHPFHAPSGVLLNEANPFESACIRCNTCDGFPCMMHAKADAEVIAVRPILDMPNVALVTGAEVTELLVSKRRVIGVMTVQGDRIVTYKADTVVLSAGAANSAKILLSSNRIGIANSSDQVGRNYMAHNSRAVIAIDRKPNQTVFQKTLALHDHYDTLGSIQMVGKSNAAAMKGENHLAAMCPGWSLAKIAAHSVDFWLTTEDLPIPENRVTLASSGDIRLAYRETNHQEATGLSRELRKILNHIGAAQHHIMDRNAFTGMPIPIAGVAHQAGTCKMGEDPSTSVLNPMCRTHDLDNLYVVDASFMPSIGAVNPALTIMANALRVGAHLSEV